MLSLQPVSLITLPQNSVGTGKYNMGLTFNMIVMMHNNVPRAKTPFIMNMSLTHV